MNGASMLPGLLNFILYPHAATYETHNVIAAFLNGRRIPKSMLPIHSHCPVIFLPPVYGGSPPLALTVRRSLPHTAHHKVTPAWWVEGPAVQSPVWTPVLPPDLLLSLLS